MGTCPNPKGSVEVVQRFCVRSADSKGAGGSLGYVVACVHVFSGRVASSLDMTRPCDMSDMLVVLQFFHSV